MSQQTIDPAVAESRPISIVPEERQAAQEATIAGLDLEQVQRLAWALGSAGVRSVHAGVLPSAFRVLPLVEHQQQTGLPMGPEDVEPYLPSIKGLSTKLSVIDALSRVVPPLNRRLDEKIKQEFPERATQAIERARERLEALPELEEQLELIAGFENPKEQFMAEVADVAASTRDSIIKHHARRIINNIEPEPATPKGKFGLFTSLIRKVRNFFGFFRRNKQNVNQEITAYDAANGIDQTIKSLLRDPEDTKRRLPLMSGLVLNRVPKRELPGLDYLAIGAPEILKFLFSALPRNHADDQLMASIHRNPQELRFAAKDTRRVGRYSIGGLRYASRNLLPAIRDVLPTDGRQIMQEYHAVKQLLQPIPQQNTISEIDDSAIAAEPTTRRYRFKNRLKNLRINKSTANT